MTFYPNLREKANPFLSIYPRWAQVLLCALLSVKLLITVFNATVYDAARQYDPGLHFPALASCGFFTSARTYNPPLYHWLSCPAAIAAHLAWLPDRLKEFHDSPEARAAKSTVAKVRAFAKFEARTLQRDLIPFVNSGPVAMARTWNLLFIAAFYALACFFLFPSFLGDWRACLFASITLLAFPGYQRMAVMVNPENLLNFATLAGFVALYFAMKPDVRLRTRWRTSFVVIAALTLTRPLAVVPVAAYSAYIFLKPALQAGVRGWRGWILHARKYLLLFAAIAVVGSAWWIYRIALLGPEQAFRSAPAEYLNKYAVLRPTFDFAGFYTTTHFSELFRTPNRRFDAADPPCVLNGHTCSGEEDSFLTLLFSETFGEHWLYTSGPHEIDDKIIFKRISLAVGALLSPLLLALIALGAWQALRTAPPPGLLASANMEKLEWMTAALVGFGGFAAFMLWQITAGLEPGKNSSIKFTYFAFAVPFLLIFAGKAFPKTPWLSRPLLGLSILSYVAALPIATFWT